MPAAQPLFDYAGLLFYKICCTDGVVWIVDVRIRLPILFEDLVLAKSSEGHEQAMPNKGSGQPGQDDRVVEFYDLHPTGKTLTKLLLSYEL